MRFLLILPRRPCRRATGKNSPAAGAPARAATRRSGAHRRSFPSASVPTPRRKPAYGYIECGKAIDANRLAEVTPFRREARAGGSPNNSVPHRPRTCGIPGMFLLYLQKKILPDIASTTPAPGHAPDLHAARPSAASSSDAPETRGGDAVSPRRGKFRRTRWARDPLDRLRR